jgi:hypothetical protein
MTRMTTMPDVTGAPLLLVAIGPLVLAPGFSAKPLRGAT